VNLRIQKQLIFFLAFLIVACRGDAVRTDADVIVIGAGIAGIAAALEAAANGAHVLVVEASSVPGGHAIMAGGFSLVGTPLQERKGFTDTPEIAYRDLMAWGEDADPYWVRYYVENSRVEVYDWLTSLGVKFVVVLDTPEDTVPRFHFTRGAAVNAMLPMLRAALKNDRIEFLNSNVATALIRSRDRVTGVNVRNTRTGQTRILHAQALILATGGFQSNLDMVRANWGNHQSDQVSEPAQLLIGSGQNATGSGIDLGKAVGADLTRMDHQVTFVSGLGDPRNPGHGLLTQNTAAIWVNADGHRFISESVNSKAAKAAVLTQSPQTHWLIFDVEGRRQLRIRGAVWLNPTTITREILDNPVVGHKSGTIAELADATGLPAANLSTTIDRYNSFVAAGEDLDFQRFNANTSSGSETAIRQPPFYALQLFPMTRKSMGGLAIDRLARVVDGNKQPIAGLYAAGELTGVAGINGSHGGAGTFLGPSIVIGKIAGRSATEFAGIESPHSAAGPPSQPDDSPAGPESKTGALLDADQLRILLSQQREGYWHFERSHTAVLERDYRCDHCHSSDWPTGPASTAIQRLLQLDSCTECH
jgi:succinate dehydrogenase/fumarate reductase flavoprotein subunit